MCRPPAAAACSDRIPCHTNLHSTRVAARCPAQVSGSSHCTQQQQQQPSTAADDQHQMSDVKSSPMFSPCCCYARTNCCEDEISAAAAAAAANHVARALASAAAAADQRAVANLHTKQPPLDLCYPPVRPSRQRATATTCTLLSCGFDLW